jgi:hypothetical protein
MSEIDNLLSMKLLLLFLLMVNSSKSSNIECLIESTKYLNEYLYADEVPVKSNQDPVYMCMSTSINDLDRIKWSLIQLDDTSYVYLLKNRRNGEYLCATSDLVTSPINKKRPIYTKWFGRTDVADDECKWKIERSASESEKRSYIIWNIHYNIPLYASKSLKNAAKNRRNVYLLDKNPNYDYFKWSLDC